jgi:hypothetical protein
LIYLCPIPSPSHILHRFFLTSFYPHEHEYNSNNKQDHHKFLWLWPTEFLTNH